MASITRFIGMDVHAATIAVAVAEKGGEVRSLGTVPNRPDSIRKLLRRLGSPEQLHACYEAGCCGYVLYWQLAELGIRCDVVAPSLIPVRSGDRVKTDRRDAEKLARCLRAGDLTPVWVPDAAHEALRDLVRARLVAKQDLARARHRVGHLLLRTGTRDPEKGRAWSRRYFEWLATVQFSDAPRQAAFTDYCAEVVHHEARVQRLEAAIDGALTNANPKLKALYEALQGLRGVAKVTAATIVVEVGDLSRFARAPQLMSYAGIVPSEHSSGGARRQGAITKAGNHHLRRVMIEAGWAYRHKPWLGAPLRKRLATQSEAVRAISWKAQNRLHKRYMTMIARGKPTQMAVTAVARELLGFVWAVGRAVDHDFGKGAIAAA
jgi:transposase